ncbi:MAG: DUF4405 domain-containing protein [Eggerthellaceae bacterium]|nr:DUF4405 domain-containing protein [Eggerthellaceae bacterium]
MNGKKVARVVLDVALTAMIVAEMFIQYTGTFLHEVIGFAFFATVVVHLALSAKWIKTTAKNASKGKMTARRTALAVMGILLTVCMVVLGVSSVAISGILADAGLVWTLGSYAAWKTIHAVSSYALCALVVIHLGMHWAFLASAFHVPYDPSRRRAISTGVHATAALGALALGAMAVGQALPRTTGTSTATQANTTAFAGTVGDAPAASSGSSNASSSSSASGRGSKKNDRSQGSAASGTGSTGSASDGSSSSPSAGSSGDSSSTATGICTLCRKQCSLSAPKCNKPYAAGLL